MSFEHFCWHGQKKLFFILIVVFEPSIDAVYLQTPLKRFSIFSNAAVKLSCQM
jgi:hypothetical protein